MNNIKIIKDIIKLSFLSVFICSYGSNYSVFIEKEKNNYNYIEKSIIETINEYTEWEQQSETCGSWSPTRDAYPSGVSFQQSIVCNQEETRMKYTYNLWSNGLKTLDSEIQETQTKTETKYQQNTGTNSVITGSIPANTVYSCSNDWTVHNQFTMSSNTSLVACDGTVFSMQGDGNLVLYYNNKAIWSSGTAGYAGAYMVKQVDGNLVVYHGGTAIWSSGTVGYSTTYLHVRNGGSVYLINSNGAILWQIGY